MIYLACLMFLSLKHEICFFALILIFLYQIKISIKMFNLEEIPKVFTSINIHRHDFVHQLSVLYQISPTRATTFPSYHHYHYQISTNAMGAEDQYRKQYITQRDGEGNLLIISSTAIFEDALIKILCSITQNEFKPYSLGNTLIFRKLATFTEKLFMTLTYYFMAF